MSLTVWLAFVVASAVLLVLPGPTVLLVVSYALTQGRRAALAVAAGVALGDFTALSLSLAGLGALLLASSTVLMVLKFLGAAYLVFLGVRLWRAPLAADAAPEPVVRNGRRMFFHAFAVTALNPKSIAFFVAFVPQFIDHRAHLVPQFAIVAVTFVVLAAANALAFALAADRLGRRIRRPSVARWLNRAGGGCLIGMGAATAAWARS